MAVSASLACDQFQMKKEYAGYKRKGFKPKIIQAFELTAQHGLA